MNKIKNRAAPSSFLENLSSLLIRIQHAFQVAVTENHKPNLRKCRFRISIRGPAIWNDLVGSTEKEIQSSSFKTKIKIKLLNFENEVTFF